MNFSKKGNRKFLNSKLLFEALGILFLIIIFVLILADIKMYQRRRGLTSQINTYQQKVEIIKKSAQTLKDEIANTDNKDYLEKLGYEQFDQARPGETVYMFVVAPREKIETVPAPKSFWGNFTGSVSSWWSWLKSKF